jgi:hypothetical protein
LRRRGRRAFARRAGTGTVDYDPYANQAPPGDWPLPGFSKILLNGSVRYRWESGFGAGLNAQGQSWQRGNLDNEWRIPAQQTVNAPLVGKPRPPQLADRRNWIFNGDAYTAGELIFPELPFRMEGYFKYKF